MNRPFDFIEGKKIDLKNQSHRDIVIQRNKTLQKAIDEGIYIFEDKYVNIEVITRVTINCLVCGTELEADKCSDFEEALDGYYSNLPVVKCSCCKTSYHYYEKESIYQLKIPKPKRK